VTVQPDLTGVDKVFDYSVPSLLAAKVQVGTIVRVPLQGRRVRGWVVAAEVEPAADVELKPVADVVSAGPSPEIVGLARYAAWRYAGRLRPFLVAASPPRVVTPKPRPSPRPTATATATATAELAVPISAAPRDTQVAPAAAGASSGTTRTAQPHLDAVDAAVRDGLGRPHSILRLPPSGPRIVVVRAALGVVAAGKARTTGARLAHGSLLVLVPERRDAELLDRLLVRSGVDVALYPDRWAQAASGAAVVVGTRTAALATLEHLAGVIVLDAHAEAYVDQRAPTWNATVLCAERAERAGVACMLVSPCPTVEQLAVAHLVELPRAVERAGWPPVEVLDRRDEDPRSGLYSPRLAPLLTAAVDAQPGLPVVCVLNRTGRARLLACGACGEVVRCETCGAALAQRASAEDGERNGLECPRCPVRTPSLCPRCGSTRLRTLRVGTTRAAEEIASLTGRLVGEVSGSARGAHEPADGASILVGTEAVLHRVRRASLVAVLDFDQELLAPRFRAPEQAFALLARAARLVGAPPGTGGERTPGHLVVQTRLPSHEVVRSAVQGDPGVLARAEADRRSELGLPPTKALARLSGAGAPALARALTALAPERRAGEDRAHAGVEVAAVGEEL
jgi:primosomal protein N' (replication factor Y)